MLYLRQVLPAPSRADQEAKAERDPDGRKRALRNDILQGFLDRQGGVLGGVHHGAAAFRHIVNRRVDIRTGFLIAAARLLLGGAGERIEHVGDLVGQGGDIVFHGCYILLEAFISRFIRQISHSDFAICTRHQKLPETTEVTYGTNASLCGKFPLVKPDQSGGSCGGSADRRCSLRMRATIKSGEDRKPPIGPHSHVQNANATNTASAFSSSRRPMMVGVIKWPSRKVSPTKAS